MFREMFQFVAKAEGLEHTPTHAHTHPHAVLISIVDFVEVL